MAVSSVADVVACTGSLGWAVMVAAVAWSVAASACAGGGWWLGLRCLGLRNSLSTMLILNVAGLLITKR
eukprot:4613045-Amphidinium_carterae.1